MNNLLNTNINCILIGRWVTALYRKNLQGDITGVIEASTGMLVAEYTYDAYGNVKFAIEDGDLGASLLGTIVTVCNPLLYRGYAYSILGGTLAYYLGSRFYMPQLGRFLNADKHTDTDTGVIGTNMYAYCNNNPVMFIDPTGEMLATIKLLSVIVNFFAPLSNAIAKSRYKKQINSECIEILKRFGILHKKATTNIYHNYTITSSKFSENKKNGSTIISMEITSKHFSGEKLYIEATFDLRSVKDWYAYVNKSITDMIPICKAIADWSDRNQIVMLALSDCATGTLADILFVLDALEVFFAIYDEFFPSKKEKYVIEELNRLGYTADSNESLIVLDKAYSYQVKNKWFYTRAQRYNEIVFCPYA